MILGRDIHPEKKIYHTGALIIDVLKETPANRLKYFELYSLIRQKHHLTLNAFTLTLDWLYLLGAVRQVDGEVEKCF